jgi:hypothetical protein
MIAGSLLSLRNEVQRFKVLIWFFKLIHNRNIAIDTNLSNNVLIGVFCELLVAREFFD